MPVNAKEIAKVYLWSKINQSKEAMKVPCCLCGTSAPASTGICHACSAAMPRLQGPLCRCALPWHGALPCPGAPLSSSGDDGLAPLCGRCLEQPPPFLGIQATLIYGHPLDRLVNGWKHQGKLHLQRPLTHLWLNSLTLLPDTDLITPVPLHWRRQWRRGFNQAACLAEALAQRTGLPMQPLLRKRSSNHQQGSSARVRRSGRDLFCCESALNGQHILLVDDVVTTTSTARQASDALLKAGAGSVSVIAPCRVLPPGS